MSHACHAIGCGKQIAPKLFVCSNHWKKLPKPFQQAIWKEYRKGQEVRKDPSARYLAVQCGAVAVLAKLDRLMTEAHSERAACDLYRTHCREIGTGDPFTIELEQILYGAPTGMIR